MDSESYKHAWSLYIGAGVVFSLLSWRVLYRYLRLELAYLLQCLLLAVMFMPAPVTAGDSAVLAPALIVFTLDTLTIGRTADAGVAALAQLAVGLTGAVLAAVVLSILHHLVARGLRQRAAAAPQVGAPLLDTATAETVLESASSELESAPSPPRARQGGAPGRKRPGRSG
ncbi:MAG: hypothetical protein LBF16_09100 [Pseudomonadales bacterium]|jgi:hypothetical protein|nr:hypothetical protein [Pseudomonadales bacterium]